VQPDDEIPLNGLAEYLCELLASKPWNTKIAKSFNWLRIRVSQGIQSTTFEYADPQ
jgi:hypothetical protein